MDEREMLELVRGLNDVLKRDGAVRACAGDMGEDERGFSGAEVFRARLEYGDGTFGSVIFKRAELAERGAMLRLTRQGHKNVPAAYVPDAHTDAPAWMALEDMGRPAPPAFPDKAWLRSVAEALADIHAANMGRGADMPWLPRADASYWRDVITRLSVNHFERKLESSAEFAREFGAYLEPLRRRARALAADMNALYAEGDSLTLTHGDLQTTDGAHIYDVAGTPFIIDFGWCRYAPFYVDLASYFTDDGARMYYDALASRGAAPGYADFEERLRAARAYAGLIYMCPAVIHWGEGPTPRTGRRLLYALCAALSGEVPERRASYSDAAFARLLAAHERRNFDNA